MNSNRYYHDTESPNSQRRPLRQSESKAFQSARAQELLELEEEEAQLEQIRREKIQVDSMASEIQNFQILISDLQAQLEKHKKYRPYYEKYQSMKDLLESTLQKLEQRDIEIDRLQQELNHVHSSGKQMMKSKQTEIHRTAHELANLESLYEQAQSDNQQLLMEFDKMQGEREQFINRESVKKQQFEEHFRHEIKVREDQISEFQEQIQKQREDIQRSNLYLQTAEERYAESQAKLLETLKELDRQKDTSNRLTVELTSKRIECAEAEEVKVQFSQMSSVLKKQEILFSELKTAKEEDNFRINLLQEEINLREREMNRFRSINQKLQEENDQFVQKIVRFEGEISRGRLENDELRKSLSVYLNSNENDKAYKQEMNRVRSDLNSIRQIEMDKFNSVFNSLVSSTSSQKPKARIF